MSMYSILIVDDEPDIVDLLEETFKDANYRVLTALDAHAALAKMEYEIPDIIISDNRMPMMSGIEFFETVRKSHQDVIRILMTGYADLKIAIEAINRGWVYKFITKPFKMEEILVAVQRALEHYEMVRQKQILEQQIRQQNQILEQRVLERTRALQKVTEELAHKNSKLLRQKNEIRRLFSQLQRSFLGTISVLYFALESKDQFTRGHSERVFLYALHLGQKLKLTSSEMTHLKYAALLHDLGKVGIPDSILLKNGKLTEEEYSIIKGHPVRGATILDPIQFLACTRDVIRQHHEHFDGTGYPDGLASEGIDIKGRIIAVADAYDAMRSDRPYRHARSRQYALDELKSLMGQQFCPQCVLAFDEVLDDIGDFYDEPQLLDKFRSELIFMEEDMRGINDIISRHMPEEAVA